MFKKILEESVNLNSAHKRAHTRKSVASAGDKIRGLSGSAPVKALEEFPTWWPPAVLWFSGSSCAGVVAGDAGLGLG